MTRATVVLDLAGDHKLARDLVAGGVFVPGCTVALLQDCELVVRSGGEELRVAARVVFVDPRGAGLELDCEPEVKQQLAAMAKLVLGETALGERMRKISSSTPPLTHPVTPPHGTRAPTTPPINRMATPPHGTRAPTTPPFNITPPHGTRAPTTPPGNRIVTPPHGTRAPTSPPATRSVTPPLGARTGSTTSPPRIATPPHGTRAPTSPPATRNLTPPLGARTGSTTSPPPPTAPARTASTTSPPATRPASTTSPPATRAASSTSPPFARAVTPTPAPPADDDPESTDPEADEADEAEARKIPANVHERMRGLTLVQQIKAANHGEISERIVLERIYGKTVWEPLLRNPRITGPEVARIARMGALPRPMVEMIVANGAWLQIPEIRRALLTNPRLGVDQIARILRLLPKHELKIAASQSAYPHAVREAAKRMLREQP